MDTTDRPGFVGSVEHQEDAEGRMMALAGLSDEWDAWRQEHPHGSAGDFFEARQHWAAPAAGRGR